MKFERQGAEKMGGQQCCNDSCRALGTSFACITGSEVFQRTAPLQDEWAPGRVIQIFTGWALVLSGNWPEVLLSCFGWGKGPAWTHRDVSPNTLFFKSEIILFFIAVEAPLESLSKSMNWLSPNIVIEAALYIFIPWGLECLPTLVEIIKYAHLFSGLVFYFTIFHFIFSWHYLHRENS